MGPFLTSPNFVGLLAAFAVGAVVLAGLLDNAARKRKQMDEQERNTLDQKIRSLYQEEKKLQDDKIDRLQETVTELSSKVTTLEAENKIMKDLIQGRDKETLAYRERGLKAMDLSEDMAKIITSNGKKTDALLLSMESQNKNITRLAQAIEKHLKNQKK